jgi:predicted nucleic acid-binding protein
MPNARISCFVDTNILIYTVDPAEPEKRQQAVGWLTRVIRSHTLVLSPQSLNECYRAVTDRRGLMPRADARRFIAALAPFCSAPAGFVVSREAWRIQDAFAFGWWDCLLLAAASLAHCGIFLSEDMKHQQRLGELTILDPFKLDPESSLPV